MSVLSQSYIKYLNWEVLLHPTYSSNPATSDYYIFWSMGYALAEQHFHTYEYMKTWLDECIFLKGEDLFDVAFMKFLKDVKHMDLVTECFLRQLGFYFI